MSQLTKVRFYGASDDLVEVEGDIPGCDEYCTFEPETFYLAGLVIKIQYNTRGTWEINVSRLNELHKVTAASVKLYHDVDNHYTTTLEMWVPNDECVNRIKE